MGNRFSGILGSDEIKRLKEQCQFETFIQCMYIYTGNVYLCVYLIGKMCVSQWCVKMLYLTLK